MTSIYILLSACNQTPQEKAGDKMVHTGNKASQANKEAVSKSKDVAEKKAEATVYANLTAANEAISKIPAPELSNDEARQIYSKLGKTIVDRINARSTTEIINKEEAIGEIKADITAKFETGKISQTDRDNILKYLNDCIVAVKSTM